MIAKWRRSEIGTLQAEAMSEKLIFATNVYDCGSYARLRLQLSKETRGLLSLCSVSKIGRPRTIVIDRPYSEQQVAAPSVTVQNVKFQRTKA